MPKYEVTKVPLMDFVTKKPLKIGNVIDRKVKEIEAFEGKYGEGYLKRIEEQPKKVGD